jgi:hypothetical protein
MADLLCKELSVSGRMREGEREKLGEERIAVVGKKEHRIRWTESLYHRKDGFMISARRAMLLFIVPINFYLTDRIYLLYV